MFAAASVCALASAAPAAASSGYGQLIVNPGTVSPGQTVSILGTCPNNGSPMTGVFSAAFDGGQASVSQGSVNFTGSATIANGVSSGQYEVAAKCGPGSPMVVITVAGGSGGTMPSTPAATTPGGSSWTSTAPSSGMSHKYYPSSPASLGNAGAGAMGGGMKPTKPASSASAGMSATAGAGAAAGSSVNAADPPVTSTGIIRVGLAGSGQSNMTTPIAAAAAAAIVITGVVGFLLLRRRRNTPGTHI
jgi:hypothetical protein